MSPEALRQEIEELAALAEPPRERVARAVEELCERLEAGSVRAAEPHDGGWQVEAWVKQGILLGFRSTRDVATTVPPVFHFRDREAFPPTARFGAGARVVPGGTTVRRGAHVGPGVVIMPPAFVNVGAYVGAGSMIDSHALVGSCAQVGSRVHLSAAAQLGGVLEPIGALPVIVEDDVFVGGGCGIYEGTRVGKGAVLAPGVLLTRGVEIVDLVHERAWRATDEAPLCVPPGAVVVPGSRPARGEYAREHAIHVYGAVIVKYRDAGTAAAVSLEQALR